MAGVWATDGDDDDKDLITISNLVFAKLINVENAIAPRPARRPRRPGFLLIFVFLQFDHVRSSTQTYPVVKPPDVGQSPYSRRTHV